MKARAVVTDSITASQGTVVSPEQARGGWLPTRRLVLYAALPAAVALCALVRTQAAWTALGIDILLAVACVADRIRTPKRAVIVERKVPAVLAIGRPNVITLRLKNDTGRTLSVEVNDDLFEGAVVRGLPGRVELRPFGSAELSYQLCPLRRGAYALGDHFVRYTLSGALLTRQERLAAHDLLRVYPDVLAVRQYESWARRGKEHLPGTATVRGAGAEFEQLRPYGRDDQYRHIDWKATARRRAITVRQFQTETQQSVVAMVDCGRAMRAEAQGISFLDHALNAVLMLSHVALSRGDLVGLIAFDTAARRFVPPGPGPATERKILNAVYDLDARFAEPDYLQMFSLVRARVQRRSLVVLFTQVLDAAAAQSLSTLLSRLLPHHLPLCVLLRNRDVDQLAVADVTDDRGLYVCGAAAEAILWRDQWVKDLRAAGALVIDAYPEQLTPRVVRHYVDAKTRRLL